jgi:uncharacterized protein (DUF2252 family)
MLGRRGQAEFAPLDRDPVAIIESQNATRLPDLVPVRIGRMLQSPLAYYRGTAAVMAHDLATGPRTGHHVTICGDAHVSNFGLFASPERRVLFDLNDFDEASVGPWEWDVKRLATSVVLADRSAGRRRERAADATQRTVASYRATMASLSRRSALDRYYYVVETDRLEQLASASARKILRRTVGRAAKRTSDRLLERITTTGVKGSPVIVEQPPITTHVADLTLAELSELWTAYRSTLRADVAVLSSQFRLTDYVLRVVGVGSVGTRSYVALFQGPAGEPLFLQVKEAGPSVIQTYGRIPPAVPAGVSLVGAGREGYRVVTGQRILQAQSDPFLGWTGGAKDPPHGRPVDYYWRQFRDMKGSVDLDGLSASQMGTYGELCGTLLARAHSQSSHPAVIDSYLGRSDRFERAITTWATKYADQVERDFRQLEHATTTGRLPVEHGV